MLDLKALIKAIRVLFADQARILEADDPNGICAAHHKGQMVAYNHVLFILSALDDNTIILPEEKSMPKTRPLLSELQFPPKGAVPLSLEEEAAKLLEKTKQGAEEYTLVARLIDLGTELDEIRKQSEATVKEIKAQLLVVAERLQQKELRSQTCVAKIAPSTSHFIPPRALLTRLKELGKQALFDTLFEVRMTDTTKYLGEAVLGDITKKESKEYASVSLKRTR